MAVFKEVGQRMDTKVNRHWFGELIHAARHTLSANAIAAVMTVSLLYGDRRGLLRDTGA